MSHMTKLKMKIDVARLRTSLQKSGITWEEHACVKFWDGTKVTGLAFKLPGWHYPVVVTDDGQLYYDNFAGYWGDINELNKVIQAYSTQLIQDVALSSGLLVEEIKQKEDGSVVAVLLDPND